MIPQRIKIRSITDLYDRTEAEPNTGCFLWTRYRDPKGYGKVGSGGTVKLAHRLAWELVNGPLPTGAVLLHRCDTPSCVNPDHMFVGSQADNMRDMVAKRRNRCGESHWNSRLSAAVIAEIRSRDVSQPGAQARIAEEFGISTGTTCRIVNRKTRVLG